MKFKDSLSHKDEIKTIYNISKVDISHLPYSLRVLLENYVRNTPTNQLDENIIEKFTSWNGEVEDQTELTFYPSRVIMQDFTGVPAVVDLASMRDAVKRLNGDPSLINPQCQTDLVIDHSVMVDHYGRDNSRDLNTKLEYKRNIERYRLLKWGQSAFKNLRIVPPNNGIIHQINIEYISRVIFEKQKIVYPDTVVGTDSHTTMVNGLGVLGWGVGGIEAEAAMLGQPIPMLLPEVIGFELTGDLEGSTTATDLVLTIVEHLRKANVVGKFVEFHGDALDRLSIADRCTIANMAPEYGATCGFFPVDEMTLDYLSTTGKDDDHVDLVKKYSKSVSLFRDSSDKIRYSKSLHLDISTIKACVSGPKRPEDRVDLTDVKVAVQEEIKKLKTEKTSDTSSEIQDGSIMIAAITSCTNTSNPSVIIGAGLVAKKAVEHGLNVKKWVKTSLAPGSRVVENYLKQANLLKYFDKLGFNIIGYGCTTCIGNSGPLPDNITDAVKENNLYAVSVLSGNRNFEGRISPLVKANYLASPPLVVAYAIAGSMRVDLYKDSLGKDNKGHDVYLKDIWPSNKEIEYILKESLNPEMFVNRYSNVSEGPEQWQKIKVDKGSIYNWEENSTYVKKPPFFENLPDEPEGFKEIKDARPLLILGDMVTTDHISPAGSIQKESPTGNYFMKHQILPKDYNSYGARRGNHEVMMRGTFANIRIRNEMAPGTEGGFTTLYPEKKVMPIYDAVVEYKKRGTDLVVIGGKEYGTGSSRDWAAKGTKLLGVKTVIAESFERIHRSNLIGMGILPLQFIDNIDRKNLKLIGSELISIINLENGINPSEKVKVEIKYASGEIKTIQALCRIDTKNELEYYKNGGILQFVLRNMI